ncbi:MAG: hypothetical protein QOI88_4612 [Gammaproteobacteria bacterium]|nr:hypothetical protein [Gammaproteobacteria bacterium]
MSLIATAAAASAASPTASLFTHGHKKGSHAGSAKDGTTASSAQAPATTQSLLSSLFESIQQVMGISITAPTLPASATAAAGAVTGAAGASASAVSSTTTPSATAAASAAEGSAQDVQSFLHSLLQALKADGLGGSSGATASAAGVGTGAAVGAGATSGTVRYDGSLVSSLQTLIHQVDSNGPATAATSNLSTSFNKLIQSGSGGAGVADAGSGTASQASLQNFLSNLLQNVQSSGVHSISAIGGNVNAKV